MWRACWVIVLCAGLVGCITRTDRPSASVARSLAPASPAEGIYLESILLERPIGDQFLDSDIWNTSLPVGSPETSVLLNENGLRAAILAGNVPQQFQTLLESENEAIGGRGYTFAMRKEEVLPTAGPHTSCKFDLLTDLAGKRTRTEFKNARCGILVHPEETKDGRVKITCEPQIQHGERQEYWRPSTDGTGWVWGEAVPLARFQELTFTTPLGRNEYLIIGWQANQTSSLGEALFGVKANGFPRQRVLVIRAYQVNPNNSSDLPSLGFSNRPSVAAQASRPR